MKLKNLFALTLVLAALTACKKTKTEPTPDPVTPVTPSGTRAELTKDSIFLYAKDVYLWNEKLPTYEVFNPRKYTSRSTEASNYAQVLFEITKYSNPYEYKTGDVDSKFSYIFDKANQNPIAAIHNAISSVDLEGNGNDLGIRFGYYGTDASYTIYVSAVYQNSPAEAAGFVRGDKITKINGVSYGTNFSTQITALTNAISGNSATFEGVKADGNAFSNLSVTKSVFKSSPIYKAKTLTAGNKKIGYLAYARFSSAANSNTELDTTFAGFAKRGVTDLIIDLRFNGGGYVSTAEHLINLIAPSTATGVMFKEYFNSSLQAGKTGNLSHQPLLDANDKVQFRNGKMLTYADIDYSVSGNTTNFEKAGSLTGITNVVFIVSGNTASAAELVINCLKPKMTVKMVGQTTYGKPVGFFPITIENKYDVYYSMFESKNSAGEGGYYDGLVPDVRASEVPIGTIMYGFGDVNDNYLKQALTILAPGVTVTSQAKTMTAKQQVLAVKGSEVMTNELTQNEFVGMIENRLKIKK